MDEKRSGQEEAGEVARMRKTERSGKEEERMALKKVIKMEFRKG